MSALLKLKNKHRAEVEALRKACPHKQLKHYRDRGVVGCGSAWPSHWIICKDCGIKKIVFVRSPAEAKKKVVKTLRRQGGFTDERTGCQVQYDWELE